MAALKGGKTLAELAQQFDVHPNQITDWKDPLMERAAQVLGDGSAPARTDPDLTKLHAMLSAKKSGQEQLLPALLTLVRRHATSRSTSSMHPAGPDSYLLMRRRATPSPNNPIPSNARALGSGISFASIDRSKLTGVNSPS